MRRPKETKCQGKEMRQVDKKPRRQGEEEKWRNEEEENEKEERMRRREEGKGRGDVRVDGRGVPWLRLLDGSLI